jgi:hypothetical protein
VAGPLLACSAALAFCSGLIGLAASSLREEAPAPLWLILVYGGGCVLSALLAALLSGPRRRLSFSTRRLRARRVGMAADGGSVAACSASPSPIPRGLGDA